MLTHIEEFNNGQWVVVNSETKAILSIRNDKGQAQRESDYINQKNQ